MTIDNDERSPTANSSVPPAVPAATPAEDVPFPLQDNENVITVCRRHWIFLWPHTIWLALWGLVPVVVAGLVLSWIGIYDDGYVAEIYWIASVIWLLYWAVRIFLNWYRYRHDIWVITNQRIVDSLKNHPFHHKLSTADLVNVQDMTVERSGLLQTTLNYGDILCQTAGMSSGDFRLSGIPHPQEVQLLVDRERDRERTRGR
jgi:hypothetical protein